VLRQAVADAVALHAAREVLDVLAAYAQERGQAKRACDGVTDVVAALRKAQVETLLVTTGEGSGHGTLFFGPDPTQLGTSAQEVRDLGAEQVQEGPLVDVLVRAALGTSAGVQVVPAEAESAPQGGVGALLRYADSSA
jgi:hypothetical protein